MIPLKDENPTATFPFVNISLIVINVLVYLVQWTMTPRAEWFFVHTFGAIPLALSHLADPFPGFGPPFFLTPATSMFLHGDLIHLAGNMLYLYIFGDNIEDMMGHFAYALFYLACGILATLAYTASNPYSDVPLIGASGAVAGVMGAYLILFPRARVLTLFLLVIIPIFIWVPAVVLLAIWLLVQFVHHASAGGGQTVAWSAHIAGFFAGMIGAKLLIRRPPPPKAPRPWPSPRVGRPWK